MKSLLSSVCLLALASGVVAQNTQTSTAAVASAAATALTSSPTSHVRGKAFDRFVVIWLENTDYTMAVGDPNLASLAKQGILLENYFGVTHPSEPNYAAAIGGDTFGMDNDNFNQVPSNISTVIDLLEDKGISWGHYQEDMPYSGFEGYSWVNQQTKKNDYVRKHNPAVIYNANADSPHRLSQIKNTTMFFEDLNSNKLPQWMFITPNMTSDGHDTSVTTAGLWTKNFLTPLLTNKNFMSRTLVLVTFDETETYTEQNRVMGILLGDAVPQHLVGTSDSSYYNHYSEIVTVEANWGLHTLGRFDVGANVFKFVAQQTGDFVRPWLSPALDSIFLNQSYPGMFSSVNTAVPIPVPNALLLQNFRTILPSIAKTWGLGLKNTYYKGTVEIPDGLRPPKYF
ncbi:hypothetical protein MMC25_003475 [Agyrium rufum]|nr:hypothetical protein [Agyrium rufum]